MSKTRVTFLLIPVAFCACSSSRTYNSRDGSVTVTEKGKDQATVSISGKDGKTTLDYNTGKPITDYPADAPLYKAKSLMDMKSGEKNARTVTMESTDPADKIAAFYKSELESKGWESKASVNTDSMTMIAANKGDRELVVQLANSDGKTTIVQVLKDK
jgi:hypothetical protein